MRRNRARIMRKEASFSWWTAPTSPKYRAGSSMTSRCVSLTNFLLSLPILKPDEAVFNLRLFRKIRRRNGFFFLRPTLKRPHLSGVVYQSSLNAVDIRSRASANVFLGQAKLSLTNPSPPFPNSLPSFKATLAFLRKN